MDVTTEWDAARPMRRRSSLLAADDIALLERSNGELQAKLEEALSRVRELEAALEPLAAIDVSSLTDCSDNCQIEGLAYIELELGDVRRARALLGTGAAPAEAGEGERHES